AAVGTEALEEGNAMINRLICGLTFTLTLPAALSYGQAAGMLTGAEAFGGFADDTPGMMRTLTPEDIAAAGALEPATNPSSVVAQPAGAEPRVKDGFVVEKVVDGLAQPRTMTFAPNGDLFVANSARNEILTFRFEGTALEPSERAVFAT